MKRKKSRQGVKRHIKRKKKTVKMKGEKREIQKGWKDRDTRESGRMGVEGVIERKEENKRRKRKRPRETQRKR